VFLSIQCLKPTSEFKDGYKISAISEISDLFTGDLLSHIEKKTTSKENTFITFSLKRMLFIIMDFNSSFYKLKNVY